MLEMAKAQLIVAVIVMALAVSLILVWPKIRALLQTIRLIWLYIWDNSQDH